jgi:cytochrome c oxidase subunit 4
MSGTTAEEIRRETRGYVLVFVALMALTVITVGISYLHLPTLPAVSLALLVAIVKGSLVACFFMHLISEKKAIYAVLVLTVVFFAVLMLVPLSGHHGSTAVR